MAIYWLNLFWCFIQLAWQRDPTPLCLWKRAFRCSSQIDWKWSCNRCSGWGWYRMKMIVSRMMDIFKRYWHRYRRIIMSRCIVFYIIVQIVLEGLYWLYLFWCCIQLVQKDTAPLCLWKRAFRCSSQIDWKRSCNRCSDFGWYRMKMISRMMVVLKRYWFWYLRRNREGCIFILLYK